MIIRRHEKLLACWPLISFLTTFALYVVWLKFVGFYSFDLPEVCLYTSQDLAANKPAWSRDMSARLLWGLAAVTFVSISIPALCFIVYQLWLATKEMRRSKLVRFGGALLVLVVIVATIAGETALYDASSSMQAVLLSQVPPRDAENSSHWSLVAAPTVATLFGVCGLLCLGQCVAAHLWRAVSRPTFKRLRASQRLFSRLLTITTVVLALGVLVAYANYNWPASLVRRANCGTDDDLLVATTIRDQFAVHSGAFYSVALLAIFVPGFIVLRRIAWLLAMVERNGDDLQASEMLQAEGLSQDLSQFTKQVVAFASPLLAGIVAGPALDVVSWFAT